MKKLSDAKFRNLNDGLLDYLHVKKVEDVKNSELFSDGCFDLTSPRFEEAVKYMAAYGLRLSRDAELNCMISLLYDETLHNQFLLMFDYKIFFSESFINMIVQAVVTLQLDEEFLVRLVKNKYRRIRVVKSGSLQPVEHRAGDIGQQTKSNADNELHTGGPAACKIGSQRWNNNNQSW